MTARLPAQTGALGLIMLWIVLALVAAGDDVVPGDVRVARWVQRWDGGGAEAVARFGNRIGDSRAGLALTVPLAVAFGWSRRWRPVILLVAIVAVRSLNSTVKGWIDSPRPSADLIRVTEDADGLGFPSGHAMGAALLFGALTVLAWRYLPVGAVRSAAALVCLAVIPIVGYGRVQTGAHWPTDVLGGYVLGTAILLSLVAALDLDGPPTGDSA